MSPQALDCRHRPTVKLGGSLRELRAKNRRIAWYPFFGVGRDFQESSRFMRRPRRSFNAALSPVPQSALSFRGASYVVVARVVRHLARRRLARGEGRASPAPIC
jgi:hypothetical protein